MLVLESMRLLLYVHARIMLVVCIDIGMTISIKPQVIIFIYDSGCVYLDLISEPCQYNKLQYVNTHYMSYRVHDYNQS